MVRVKYGGPVWRDPVTGKWRVSKPTRWQRLIRYLRRFIETRPRGDNDFLR